MGRLVEFHDDKRRKHHHFLVTITYTSGEQFGRVYTDPSKAQKFADRQNKSPVVKSVQVKRIS